MKYEIIVEKLENAFGKNDKFVYFDSLRVKKFNRTMLARDTGCYYYPNSSI